MSLFSSVPSGWIVQMCGGDDSVTDLTKAILAALAVAGSAMTASSATRTASTSGAGERGLDVAESCMLVSLSRGGRWTVTSCTDTTSRLERRAVSRGDGLPIEAAGLRERFTSPRACPYPDQAQDRRESRSSEKAIATMSSAEEAEWVPDQT